MNRFSTAGRIVALVTLLVAAFQVQAAPLIVTSLTDSGGPGELRWAINTANATSGSFITFQQGLSGTINLASSLPAIANPTFIQGPVTATIAVDGGGRFRPFNITAPSTVSISNLTIRNGSDQGDGQGGGGVNVTGAGLYLVNCAISGNVATGSGGGISSAGTLVLSGCTVSGNQGTGTQANGGGVYCYGSLTMLNSTVTGNTASVGGGVYSSAGANLTCCTFSGNTARINGGGLVCSGTSGVTNSGNAAMTNCIFYGDTPSEIASNGIGSLSAKNCDIQGGLGTAITNGGGNINASPLLGSLANNGGQTPTMALGIGSPCLATGGAVGGAVPGVDQRGLKRPTAVSVGAYDTATAPQVLSLSPSTAIAGGPALKINVDGVGFSPTSIIFVGGTALTTTFVNASNLSATVSASMIASPTVLAVSVVNTAGQGGSGSAVSLTVLAQVPAPVISPSGGRVSGTSPATVSITDTQAGVAIYYTTDGTPPSTSSLRYTGGLIVSTNTIITAIAVASGYATSPLSVASFLTGTSAPTIGSFGPSQVTVGSPTFTLNISGTGYVPTSVVHFGSVSLTTTYVNGAQLTATVPASALTTAAYPINVTVVNPTLLGGNSNAVFFAVVAPAPTPTFSPAGGATSTGAPVVVTISDTLGGAVLYYTTDGSMPTPASTQYTGPFTVSTGETINAIATASGVGNSSVGTATFTVSNPAPTLTSLSPTSVAVGGPSFLLTLAGTGFIPTSVVKVNGTALSATFINSTTLTVTVPAASIAATGTVPVTVTNATPGGGTSATVSFAVNNPAPTITSLAPSTALAGSGSLPITVTGTGFVASSTIKVAGTAIATTFTSSTSLSGTVPASALTSAGNVAITVMNSAPGGGTSAAANIAVSNPVPSITALSPSTVGAGSPPVLLTIIGTGFVATSTVTVGGTALTTTCVNSTTLTVTVPASLLAATGTLAVTVTNPTPGGGTSFGATLTVTSSAGLVNVLWNRTADNQALLWWMSDDTHYTYATYGPYAGYVAKAFATAPNGTVYMLWDHTADHSFVVWSIAPDRSVTYAAYGPYTAYQAIDITATGDNHAHVLIDQLPNHGIVIWDMPDIHTPSYYPYGPYAGWHPVGFSGGIDDHIRLLLDHTSDHQASVFDIEGPGMFSYQAYGPYAGYQATSIATTPDNHAHVTWLTSGPTVALWDISIAGVFTYAGYGPYSGLAPGRLGIGTGGHLRALWNRTSDGAAIIWDMSDINTFTYNVFQSPGWTCVQAGTH